MTLKHCVLLAALAMAVTYYGIANARLLNDLAPELAHA